MYKCLIIMLVSIFCVPVPLMADATRYQSQIGTEDIRYWDGVNSTFQRRTSTGGMLTMHPVDGMGVDVLTVYGSGTTQTEAAIARAIQAIGLTRKANLHLAVGTWTIANNLTVPSNLMLSVPQGATISVSSGKTLTINALLDAGPYAIFAGSGSIVFGTTVSPVRAAWFGGDLTKACASMTSYGTVVLDGPATVSAKLVLRGNGISIDGQNMNTITPAAGFSGDAVIQYGDTTPYYTLSTHLKNVIINATGINYGIDFRGGAQGSIENVEINSPTYDGIYASFTDDWEWDHVVIKNVKVDHPGRDCIHMVQVSDFELGFQGGLTIDRLLCNHWGDNGVYLENTNFGFVVKMSNMVFEGDNAGIHFLHTKGSVLWELETGWGEGVTSYPIYLEGGYGMVKNFYGPGLPYVTSGSLVICDSTFGYLGTYQYGMYGKCITLGAPSPNSATGGPPTGNYAVNTGVELLDGYGVNWRVLDGNDTGLGQEPGHDNNTSWVPTTWPLKFKFGCAQINAGGRKKLIYAPTAAMTITNVTVQILDSFHCEGATTKLSIGTDDDNNSWTDNDTATRWSTSYAPIQGKLTTNTSGFLYGGNYKTITSNQGASPFPPIHGDNYFMAFAEKSPGVNCECTSGQAMLIIDGYDVNLRPNVSAP